MKQLIRKDQIDLMRAEKTMGVRAVMKALYAHLGEWEHLELRRGVGTVHIEYDLYIGVNSAQAETVEEIMQFGDRMLKVAAIKLRQDLIELTLYREIGIDPEDGRRIVGKERLPQNRIAQTPRGEPRKRPDR